jgi:hypothetical protein
MANGFGTDHLLLDEAAAVVALPLDAGTAPTGRNEGEG